MKLTVRRVTIPILFILTAVALYFHDEPVINLAGTIAFGVYGLLILTFVIIYAGRAWRANRYGRAIMYTHLSILSVILLSFITRFIGAENWEYRYVTRLILYIVLVVTEGHLLFVLLRTPRKPKEVTDDRMGDRSNSP